MKKTLLLLTALLLSCALCVPAFAEAPVPAPKKVVVLATGGTIAGVGEAGKTAGYTPGSLSAESLVLAVPELAEAADVEAVQICNVNSDGIVIAGAGAGEFSESWKQVIGGLDIPVVISSRIDDGIIIPENLLCENTVAADNLSPQKAAILLRLALTQTADTALIAQMFAVY